MEDRRLAAIMFTDIVGYTALMGSDEDKAFDMLRRNHAIHEKLIKQFDGTLIKEIGDGTLASFSLASDAVRCALEIQKGCKEENIPLKIGIHEGEMVFMGSDVLGDGVNIASRLQESAEEGCVTISGSVYMDIKNKTGIRTEFIEEKSFKNVDEPIRIYSVTCEESQPVISGKITSDSNLPGKKSIIVLPFVDISPDQNNEYFSDGLTEEIITDLSHVHDLLVISRSSAMAFKGTKSTIHEIAKKVKVHYVLEGSVRKAGNHLRITAQLIDASNDVHLWAEKYSGILDDVFDIQEKVSSAIVDTLRIKLSTITKNRIAKQEISDLDVYDCYLKGQYELMKWTEDGLLTSLRHFQKALDITGENAVVYAGIAYSHYQFINMGYEFDEDHLKKAEHYAKLALRIDPDSPYAQVILGLCLGSWGGKFKEGIKYFKRALSVSPNDWDATYWLIAYYAHLGKSDTANSYIEQLKKIDPLTPMVLTFQGFVHMWCGEFDISLEFYKSMLDLYPGIPPIRWYYALNLAYCNRIDEACNHFEVTHKTQPNSLWYKEGILLSLALRGKKRELLSILKDSELEAWAKRNLAWSYYVAECYALIDEKEKAIDWLEISIQNGLVNYPFINEYDPFFENIRQETRFKKLMEKVKIEWENYEV